VVNLPNQVERIACFAGNKISSSFAPFAPWRLSGKPIISNFSHLFFNLANPSNLRNLNFAARSKMQVCFSKVTQNQKKPEKTSKNRKNL
jgi:hypothetical protein